MGVGGWPIGQPIGAHAARLALPPHLEALRPWLGSGSTIGMAVYASPGDGSSMARELTLLRQGAGWSRGGWYSSLFWSVRASSPSSLRAISTLPSAIAPPPMMMVVQARQARGPAAASASASSAVAAREQGRIAAGERGKGEGVGKGEG